MTGIVSIDAPDDDGNGAGDTITEEQELDLISLMSEVKANQFKFLGHFDIKEIGYLQAKDYNRAVCMLKAKRGEAAK